MRRSSIPCSFCQRDQRRVLVQIDGRASWMCDECIMHCPDYIKKDMAQHLEWQRSMTMEFGAWAHPSVNAFEVYTKPNA